jgi:hypothetical protein
MSMRVTSDPAEFAATVFPFLEKDPVLNSVLLSNVRDRATGLLTDPSLPVFEMPSECDWVDTEPWVRGSRGGRR